MAKPRQKSLTFDVSSGLKSVLGKELITDEQVALFELVKNSFDAQAKRVRLFFGENRIIVADDGIGMSLSDIKEKWLFVAYSSKRDVNRTTEASFRETVAKRKHFAGSKGIGRFSTDRLGEKVLLQTKPKSPASDPVHRVSVDWSLFDTDHKQRFEQIEAIYESSPDWFGLPAELHMGHHGTIVEILDTYKIWTRDEILNVKRGLAKLINPFGAKTDGFRITIQAPSESKADAVERKRAEADGEELRPDIVVNGDVGNFIFSTLQEKTTFIEVMLTDKGKYVESKLVDRGEIIYRVREPNPFSLLETSGFRCQVFFLNQSAKLTFAKRVGLPSVKFGSIFLFRNDFRVYPIGEEADDWFGVDRRKQQGYARFLGTRDIIGRIDVSGNDEDFQEQSSRNAGLLETPAVAELKQCFWDFCLKRLERYVVPVTWADKEDGKLSDLSRLATDPGRVRVAAAVASLVDNEEVELLEYNKRLIGILNERSAEFEESLGSLRAIAEKTADKGLTRRIDQAERRFEELKLAEAEARRQADEERKAKEIAQARARAAETTAHSATRQLEEEKKRNLFLASIGSLDSETILNMHHQITIYAVDIQHQLENFLQRLGNRENLPRSEVLNAIEQIAFVNQKVMAISKFATKANFRLESEMIEGSLTDYITQYINGVARDFLTGPMKVEVTTDGKDHYRRFKPIDVSIVVDNLIANARKARASKILFEITHPGKVFNMKVSDDGRGLHPSITPHERIFEKGFTMTDGSGLGLYHVRQVLGEMGGTIQIDESLTRGTGFQIRISK